MDNKKKGPAAPQEPQPGDAVLTLVKDLPKITNRNLRVKMDVADVESALITLHQRAVEELGIEAVEPIPTVIQELAKAVVYPGARQGIVIWGRRLSGKTAVLRTLKSFFKILAEVPDAWEYSTEENLRVEYFLTNEFRFPIGSFDEFKEALQAPVLILDSVGMETESPEARLPGELVRILIQVRHDYGLLTILGTPFDHQSLEEIYGSDVGIKLLNYYRFIELDKRYSTERQHENT